MSPAASSRTDSKVTRYILIALGLAGLAVMLWRLSGVFTIVFGGIVGAALLHSLADPLSRRTGIGQSFSLAIVVVGLLATAGLLGWLFGQQVAQQASEMERLLPQAAHKLVDVLNGSEAGRMVVRMAKEMPHDTKMLSGVGLAAGSLLFGLADLVLIFFLSLYFAFGPEEYFTGMIRLVPVKRRPEVTQAVLASADGLRRWLLAQLVAMAVVGLLVGTVMAIIGVPLALLLGAVAAILEFIPVVGAVLFTIPGVLLAFTQGPAMALYALLAYVGVQQLESNVIIPLLQKWAVRLPPALTLLSVVIGGVLFGAPGMVFASPLAVVTMILVRKLYVENALEGHRSGRTNATHAGA